MMPVSVMGWGTHRGQGTAAAWLLGKGVYFAFSPSSGSSSSSLLLRGRGGGRLWGRSSQSRELFGSSVIQKPSPVWRVWLPASRCLFPPPPPPPAVPELCAAPHPQRQPAEKTQPPPPNQGPPTFPFPPKQAFPLSFSLFLYYFFFSLCVCVLNSLQIRPGSYQLLELSLFVASLRLGHLCVFPACSTGDRGE